MTVSLVYATGVTLANATKTEGIADGTAVAFGEIDNTSNLAFDNDIRFFLPLASATAGTYSIYLVSSHDGALWTDSIDPASTATNIAARIRAAPLVSVIRASGTATNTATTLAVNFQVSQAYSHHPPYVGIVFVNNSGQTTPTGASGESTYIRYATV